MKIATTLHARSLVGAAALIASSAGLSGCVNLDTGFGGEPLADLDTSGSAPTEIALAGPDNLILTVGDALDIQVEGDSDAVDDLRFKRSDESLAVGREGSADGTATVRITMPPPREISLAGSGSIDSEALADKAEINIAGSGAVIVAEVDAADLEVSSAGSGSLTASGTVADLEISIVGSGDVDFSKLKAENVEISIAGSGDVTLLSDGRVETSIAGSGNVNVTGQATCETSSFGSGAVTCRPAQTADAGSQADPERDTESAE
ncbi:MAG: head GIN domain-containing protein [Erythrobacter sp.]|uniref:head GIN domain-containing protein n=1 Tax=Erythrobacter sp. TaxID=1042 RepID=UPI002601CC92|nr:head GIN domain-containing protein [Erythrobacter sp.]MDJ0978456.1 head GIN domain-containing protein [Erythrobacter sp.]